MKLMTKIAGVGAIFTTALLYVLSIFRKKVKRLAAQNKIYQNNINDLTNHVEVVKEVNDLKRSDLAEFVHKGKDSN